MGDVFVVYNINVEDMDKFEQVKAQIIKKFHPKETKEIEVGFGIKKLRVLITLSDEAGSQDLEQELSEIEGISSIDIESTGRL